MTPLHRKSKLRRKSKSPLRKAIDAADKALQDWHRAKYPDAKCEACGGKFEVCHHYIEKHSSARLRYCEGNLIFLCHKCHASHHFGNVGVMSKVILKRGQKWLNGILKLSREKGQINQYIAEQILEKYKI